MCCIMHVLHDVRVAWCKCCMMHVLPRMVLSISFWEQCSRAPPLFPPLGTELSGRRGPNQGKWGKTGPNGVKWCQRSPNQAIRDHMKLREDQWGQRRALYSRVHCRGLLLESPWTMGDWSSGINPPPTRSLVQGGQSPTYYRPRQVGSISHQKVP